MVVFTCAHCGEPVKKPLVSKHYERKCYGRRPDLTCVDCLKDFRDNEYETHTKCISENERYGAQGSVQPNSVNKGEQKQQIWSECIQNVLNLKTLRDDERRLIGLIAKHENVPRKKAKFQNFLNSAYKSCRFSNDLIDRVWVRMETVFKETAGNNANVNNKPGNDMAKDVDKKNVEPESKKRKLEEENQADQVNSTALADDSGIKTDKKSKKKKKNRESEETQDDQQEDCNSNINMMKQQLDNSNINDEITSESKSKKKKNKKKKNEITEIEEKSEEPDSVINGEEKKKKKKKEKSEEVSEKHEVNNKENLNQTEVSNTEENSAFSWLEIIKSVLSKKNVGEEIPIKKIEKKVLKRFSKATGKEVTEKRTKKIRNKLRKIPNVVIKGEFVVLQ